MSMHINLVHSYGRGKGFSENTIKFVDLFLNYFEKEFKVLSWVVDIEHETFFKDKSNGVVISQPISKSKVLSEIKGLSKKFSGYLPFLQVEVEGKFLNMDSFIKIYNRKNVNLYGDIEIDIYANEKVKSFLDLLKNKKILTKKFNSFFRNIIKHNTLNFRRVYVDLKDEGKWNALDKYYEHDTDENRFFVNVLNVLEKSDKEEYQDLYDSFLGYDRDFVPRKLWNNDINRQFVTERAEELGISFSGGSFRMFAEDKNKLVALYDECIKSIIKPIFDIKPFEERVEETSLKLKHKLKKK